MGSVEVRNPLLSKKLKRTETRLLIIDDNQIRFNQIRDLLTQSEHQVEAVLLDDLQGFEKQLNLNWDLIIFGRAYDLKYEQALSLIRLSKQPNLPILLLKPDDYQADQYPAYVHKGIYDILNLDYPDRFYLGLIRALSFSRLMQTQQQLLNELETAQSQAQSLVVDSHKALAVIQEGIHIQANAEYLSLFGLKSEDEIIGLPLLDVLQPKDLPDFKTRFKKISQGQFDFGRFELDSQNSKLSTKNPLKIEFIPAAEDDALQIAIDIESTSGTKTSNDGSQSKPNTYQQIKRAITQQPSNINALVLFALASAPEQIFQSDWNTLKSYFEQVKNFLKEQTNAPLFKIDGGVYVGLFQAESQAILESKLIGLNALRKPQLLTVNNNSYPLNLRLGYSVLEQELRDETVLEQCVEKAFLTELPQNQPAPELELSIPSLEFAPQSPAVTLEAQATETQIPSVQFNTSIEELAPISALNESPIIKALRTCLERGEIHLKYQQLYDKDDQNMYTYEVTSGFIYDNKWRDISQLKELAEDSELSIKLDRWIMVESCKQLHNFITQYPEAKLIINLNKEILLKDRSFPEFVAKLLTIIRSKQQHPLILQFSEDDIYQSLADAQKAIIELRRHGAEIAIRDFGQSMFSESLLTQVEANCLTLHPELTHMLNSDKLCEELQLKIVAFRDIKPVQIMLRGLNDMTLFANAWNVDARFIQGDYFQKKLDHLIDVQDQ
ncbi:EAL domain-containing protein [Acinetobacter cumulans]|uniref:EAL domain-containing protein n=1 Tax=Acinetobacter TaxID=469 RepID=UPI000D130BF0|nr:MULTISPECIES: EAL domain-containing protein [Acinetobacter]QCO21720.1 EAL domain-containing protein [Acinetobacter cumulans]RFS31275.1 EAL domain-containing protein [Acinetobacter sp. SWAC5]RKG44408.1 EAL domain-containing protein [Acinetobacter cumulans]RKG47585.1 EAL domain-containing protein [Acinetobacter cumulans]RZG58286.1 EAL domain-containing protein [Acinetobacter sp. WCHAc060006]